MSSIMAIVYLNHADKKNPECFHSGFFGGDSWDRTSDLMHVKHTL